MIHVRDALQRDIQLPSAPRRVVSLVPSDTLSVARLGAAERLVGRTDYCVDPPELAGRVTAVGGTKNPRIDAILGLAPDLVLANQEENSRPDIEKLASQGVRVYVSFPRRVAEGVSHLAVLAKLLGVQDEPVAREQIRRGYHLMRETDQERASQAPLRVFCPIWMAPLMTIHGDTFISDMLAQIGAENVFRARPRHYPLAADMGKTDPLPEDKVAGRDTRYPRVTLDEVIAHAPDVILLPDEPHPFSEADADVFRALPIPAARNNAIVRCSGQDLCWYGAHSLEGLPRMKKYMDSLRARLAVGTSPRA